jgi:hypothetical protein
MYKQYETCWVVYHSRDWELKVACGWRTTIVDEVMVGDVKVQFAQMIYDLSDY